VEVEDGLASAGADVEDGAVSLLDIALTGDVGGGEVAAADEFGVGGLGLFQSGKMFFGDDENVGGGLRVDVFEGEDVVVFVDFPGGNFTGEDAAEEAIGIGHVEFTGAGSHDENNTTRGLVWKLPQKWFASLVEWRFSLDLSWRGADFYKVLLIQRGTIFPF